MLAATVLAAVLLVAVAVAHLALIFSLAAVEREVEREVMAGWNKNRCIHMGDYQWNSFPLRHNNMNLPTVFSVAMEGVAMEGVKMEMDGSSSQEQQLRLYIHLRW